MARFRFALCAGLFCLANAPALSADLPPASKAPVMVPSPVFSWTGFYLGVHAGYGWGDQLATNVNGTAPFPPGTARTADFDGAVAGGQIGYNFQIAPMWVLGVEGDMAWSGMSGSAQNPSVVPGFIGIRTGTADTDVNWVATLTGRIGISANNWLFYFKGGGAWADIDDSTRVVNPATGALLTTANGSSTRSGWTVGGGVEWGFAPQWSAKIEYNYLDFGSDTLNQNVTFAAVATPNPLVRTVDTELHLVKAGVNYRFGR